MKKLKLFSLVAFISLVTLQSCKKDDVISSDPLTSTKYAVFNDQMQKLWADHMQWTYATVDAFFHDKNSLDSKLNRLLQNQKDLGAAIVPFYGDEGGNQLAKLLTEHIMLAVPVLTAAQNGDQTALTKALDDWYANAKEIGDFLSDANAANWPKAEMEQMMKTHIDQTVAYSVALLQNDYINSVNLYDGAFSHMTEMSDMLSKGIAKQFPGKFN